jgi:hypothetical protein
MDLEDFAIGDLFLISVHLMRCVDIGTRVAIGFDLCHANKRLTKSQGEPYSPVWIIDEYDMDACTALYCLSHEELSWLRGNGKGGLRQHLKAVREAEMRENQGKADTGETTHVAKRSVPWVSLLMRDLADPQEAAGYLAAAREDSPQAYTTALRNIAKARRASRGRE